MKSTARAERNQKRMNKPGKIRKEKEKVAGDKRENQESPRKLNKLKQCDTYQPLTETLIQLNSNPSKPTNPRSLVNPKKNGKTGGQKWDN